MIRPTLRSARAPATRPGPGQPTPPEDRVNPAADAGGGKCVLERSPPCTKSHKHQGR
jgi:hypothetical protein